MRWLDKAIDFYTEWNENDKRKSSRFDISNESDFLRDYTGIRSVSIGLNYKGTDPYDSLISLLKNAKDIESLSIVGMKLSWKQVCELPLKRLRKFSFHLSGVPENGKIQAPLLTELAIFGEAKLTPLELMITPVPHIDFSGMPLLESIRFSSVQQIDPSDFKNLSGLKRLIILESNISDLNWLKDAAYNLNYLDIAGEIENCEGIVSQTNLETLCLRHHIIHDITPIKKLRNLKTLDMRYMNGDNAETLHWLGIENVIVSKRDVAIDDIKRKVEDLNRNAVSRLRSKERSLSNVELPRIQRTMLLREMQRPFERLIKNYIKANCEDKLERLQAGEYYMNSYLPKDEYIAIFKEKALQEYPFLAYEL